jgi:hypothetical protein
LKNAVEAVGVDDGAVLESDDVGGAVCTMNDTILNVGLNQRSLGCALNTSGTANAMGKVAFVRGFDARAQRQRPCDQALKEYCPLGREIEGDAGDAVSGLGILGVTASVYGESISLISGDRNRRIGRLLGTRVSGNERLKMLVTSSRSAHKLSVCKLEGSADVSFAV